MLGLLALIGVTFAIFASQARVNARNFALAQTNLASSELMDFALSQLINDTNNPQSAIRGHSLKRDMYGNDAPSNGYLTGNPTTGVPIFIQSQPTIPTSGPFAGTYVC